MPAPPSSRGLPPLSPHDVGELLTPSIQTDTQRRGLQAGKNARCQLKKKTTTIACVKTRHKTQTILSRSRVEVSTIFSFQPGFHDQSWRAQQAQVLLKLPVLLQSVTGVVAGQTWQRRSASSVQGRDPDLYPVCPRCPRFVPLRRGSHMIPI